MASTTASLSSFSSLAIPAATQRLSRLHLPPKPIVSFFPKPLRSSLKLAPIRASSDENDSVESEYSNPEDEGEVSPFQEEEEEEEPEPEGLAAEAFFDDGPMETEEEIAAMYEELYGPAFSGKSVLGNDVNVMDSAFQTEGSDWGPSGETPERIKDGFEERVVSVNRVTKVVKGGKQLNFRAVVVAGDKESHVGVGVGRAKEIAGAVQKACIDARRNLIEVPLTKNLTFPHRANGKWCGARVMLRPASAGSGVIAGGAVRAVMELAGVQNGLGKQIRSKNALNNARAAINAVQKMKQLSEAAKLRGLPMEYLFVPRKSEPNKSPF